MYFSLEICLAWRSLRLAKDVSLNEDFFNEGFSLINFHRRNSSREIYSHYVFFSLEEFFMKDLFFWGYKLCENIIFIRYELFVSRLYHMRNIASVIYVLGNFGTFYYNLDYLLMMFRKMIFFI